MGRPAVTIVIPVWNNWEVTKRCLKALRPTLGPRDRVVAVDNGSTDATAAGLGRHSWVDTVTNPDNRGFAAACNQGAARRPAMDANSAPPIVVFLNNDTVVPARWLDELTAPFADVAIGASGPRSNMVSGPQFVDEVGYDVIGLDGFRSFARDWQRDNRGRFTPCERLVGFALAVRRTAFDQIGGFDERFGIGGCEDDDLCARLAHAGWQLVIAHGSFVHHQGHATFDANGIDWFAQQQANSALLLFGSAPAAATGTGDVTGTGTGTGDSESARLSVCMIVKDEEAHLPDALASVAGVADEVIIYDTGSVDGTVALARSAGATVIEGYWNDDFARARNAALEACSGRWILHLDADEILDVDADELTELLNRIRPDIDVLLVDIYNLRGAGNAAADTQRGLRLFRRARALWRGQLHEQLVPRPGETRPLAAAVLPVGRIVHSGYTDELIDRRDKWNRNLRVAQAAYGATGSDAAATGTQRGEAELNMARALSDVGRSEEAIGHVHAAIGYLDSPVGLRFSITFGAYLLLNLQRPHEALELIERLATVSDTYEMTWFLRGAALYQLGELDEADKLLAKVTDLVDQDGFRPPEGTIGRYRSRVLFDLGRHAESFEVLIGLMDLDIDGELLVMAFEAASRAGATEWVPVDPVRDRLSRLAAAVTAPNLVAAAAAVLRLPPEGADQMAEALWNRFGLEAAILGAAAIFGTQLASVRALVWSSRLRQANSAEHCPLIARAADAQVDPLERARCAVLAVAGFGDSRSWLVLDQVMPLVSSDDLVGFVGDVAQLAPTAVETVVLKSATTPSRQRLLMNVCDDKGLDYVARALASI